jgi:hypothetical protein
MTRLPLYISDADIVRIWKEYNNSIVKVVRFEPNIDTGYRKAIVWFQSFTNYLPYPYYSPEIQLTKCIENGMYKKKDLPGSERTGNILGFLTSCCEPEPPDEQDFSFAVALKLQDVVREQTNHIQQLENRIAYIEKLFNKTIHQYTEQINHLDELHFEQAIHMREQAKRYHELESDFKEHIAKHEKQYESDHKNILELTEWCSQPIWKRTNSFVLSTVSCDDGYSLEF